jgi:hypothetical protein
MKEKQQPVAAAAADATALKNYHSYCCLPKEKEKIKICTKMRD